MSGYLNSDRAWHDDRDGARVDTTPYRDDRDEPLGGGTAYHVSDLADDRERKPFGFAAWDDADGLVGEIVVKEE